MTIERGTYFPDEDEVLRQAAASLRLEGFGTTVERLKELKEKAARTTDGPPRQRRQAV